MIVRVAMGSVWPKELQRCMPRAVRGLHLQVGMMERIRVGFR